MFRAKTYYIFGALLILMADASAQGTSFPVSGWCELGNQGVVTNGAESVGTKPMGASPLTPMVRGSGVMASYPQCSVTVYLTGTTTLPSLFTAGGSPLTNPFTASVDGSYLFYVAAAGCFDITLAPGVTAASKMPTTKTIVGKCAGGGGGGGGGGGPVTLPNPAAFLGPASFPTFVQIGFNYLTGMGSLFLPDDPNGAATYDGGPSNTLDQVKDVAGQPLFIANGSGGTAVTWPGVYPLPNGITPIIGAVLTNVPGYGYVQGDVNINVPSINNTNDYADQSQFVGDACQKINFEMAKQAASGACVDVDARGFTGVQACSVNPIPGNACSNLLPGKATYQVTKTWILPHGVGLYGSGIDTNPCSGAGTCLQAQPGLVGPIIAWGNNGSAASGQVIQYAPVRNLQVDCNNVLGCVGMQDFNAQEGSGAWDVKIPNWGMSGVGLEIGGPSFPLSDSFTTSGTTLTDNTAADIDASWINAKLQIPAGGTSYTVVSVASSTAATTATLSGTPTCSGCTIAVQGATTQNGTFERMNVSLPGTTATLPASGKAAIAVVINTGSGAFPGPKRLDNFTVTNAGSGVVTPINAVQICGMGMSLQDSHLSEGFTGSSVIIGLDCVSDDISVKNVWSSNSAAGSAVVTISNNHNVTDIDLQNIKAIGPSLPTNTINDQSNTAITTASFPSVSRYLTGKTGNVIIDSTGTNSWGGPVGTIVCSTCNVTGTQGFIVCTASCTVNLPTPVAGAQYCIYEDDNVSSSITLSAIVGVQYENTNRTSYKTANTTLSTTGATGNFICLLGRDTTHYLAIRFSGTWT